VNEELCVGCGICESVCPYGAIEVVEVDEGKKRARVTGVKCKGCGTCGSSCVKRAIKMYHFSDDQLIAQERAAVTTEAR
jgi:heterodisulfide reductase subunit A